MTPPAATPAPPPFAWPTLVLLAGGASSRMGTDKLRLRDAAGRLLVAAWAERVAWPTPVTLVLPPDATPPDELAGWPVRHDAAAGEGPLRGVQAALAGDAGWRLVVAVDTPGVGREQLDWSASLRSRHTSARAWLLRREGRIEPFPLLIHTDLREAVDRRLAGQRRSLHGLADEPAARVVDAPADWDAAVWRNLNRPAELRAYLEHAIGHDE